MKKYILILCVMTLSMVSCVKEKFDVSPSGEITAKLLISTNESQTSTRADEDIRYVAEAYYDETFTTPANIFDNGYSSRIETTSNALDIIISSSKEYYFLIWADNGESYNVDDLANVSLIAGEVMTEAWQGTLEILSSSSTLYSATLKRAVGKVNLIETEEFIGSLSVSFENYSAFNIAIGSTVGDTSTFNYQYSIVESTTGLLNEEPIYVFAPVTYSNVIDFNFGEQSVTNIPIQANYITSISGNFTSSSLAHTISIDIEEEWVDEVDEDGTIIINSIDELMRYIQMDDINAKMTPGTYEISTEVALEYGREADAYQTIVTIMLFEGDNSTYDFTDVKFEVDTDIMTAFGSVDGYTFQVIGDNVHLLNMEVEFIGDTRPTKGNTAFVVDGSNNVVEGLNMTVRGSYPYGYGDLFGKGSSPVITHYKHCGINLRGDDNTLLNVTVYQYAFGHAIHLQGSINATVKGCHTESEVRSTDELLAEEGTGSAADNVDFMTDWGYTVPAGYMYACCEAGYRAYNTGNVYNTGESRNTSDTYYIDCTAYQVRSAYNILFSDGDRYIENCSSIDCETGYGIGSSSYIYNSRGNSNYGPLIVDDYSSNKNNYIELEILPCDNIYGLHDMLAYIGGSNHTIIFTEPEEITSVQDYHSQVEIMVAGEERGMRFKNAENPSSNNFAASNMKITNNTFYQMSIASNASNNVISTKGTYTDVGTNNNVTVIE